MPKFSIIVPVYNVESYLAKCLDSILCQSYKDYEIIAINDGSTDNSSKILKEYVDKYDNIIVINQKNQGLSQARNNGVKEAKGEYIIFVDSDDFIEKDLLKKINDSLLNNPDLVRYQIREVSDKLTDYNEESFTNLSGKDAFKKIVKYHYVENAWSYAIKKEYYLKNKFSFKKGLLHEDFGLIPLVIIKANIVNSIDYIGYNYVQRNNSIMNNSNYEKIRKKAFDVLEQYLDLINKDEDIYYKSFLANSTILKLKDLNKKDYKEFLNLLKTNKVFDNVLSDTISRKIKKLLLKISPKLYLKVVI